MTSYDEKVPEGTDEEMVDKSTVPKLSLWIFILFLFPLCFALIVLAMKVFTLETKSAVASIERKEIKEQINSHNSELSNLLRTTPADVYKKVIEIQSQMLTKEQVDASIMRNAPWVSDKREWEDWRRTIEKKLGDAKD